MELMQTRDPFYKPPQPSPVDETGASTKVQLSSSSSDRDTMEATILFVVFIFSFFSESYYLYGFSAPLANAGSYLFLPREK